MARLTLKDQIECLVLSHGPAKALKIVVEICLDRANLFDSFGSQIASSGYKKQAAIIQEIIPKIEALD